MMSVVVKAGFENRKEQDTGIVMTQAITMLDIRALFFDIIANAGV